MAVSALTVSERAKLRPGTNLGSIMSRVYEALRKLGASDPDPALPADQPRATVEGDETEWLGRARPLDSRSSGKGTLQWPPPDPAESASADDDWSVAAVNAAAPTSPVVTGNSAQLTFSELIRAIARDEQDLGY